ncbi:MAG: DNA-binding protein [Acidobacteria bacterium]|nr:MAG: DNA-binding protein [Acidobacteriota bacterium]REK03133.1 MAG: DNA-binding protein [Acidobacteriota bacterium]REK15412.1 MAG: DNA-binding protein [Acidobacteriota bacterium]REK42130.1 MAG: DNA-binding protein [Acidobacteriota bacterium]
MRGLNKRYDLDLELSLSEGSGTNRLAYSLKEVAEMLGVSVNHLRNEEKRGRLMFFKSGRRTLIRKSDLEGYLGIDIDDSSDSPKT